MHADEANQAVKTGELLETGRYAFDPRDHHGPTLYFSTLPIAWIRGESTLAELSETTVRLVPALFGTAGVVLLAFLAVPLMPARRPGRPPWAAILAAAFLAFSPPAVYYSRYYVQETLLVTFTLATLLCAARWWQSGRISWAACTGIGIGLMQATKSSAPLFLILAFIAVMAARMRRPATWSVWRHLGLGLLTALLTCSVLYSSFGTHLQGITDAFAAYLHGAERLAGETGHEKPWWYYLRMFGWFREGGLTWHQLAFSMLAIAGLLLALFGRDRVEASGTTLPADDSALRAVALYSVLLMAALSLIDYKTPWHVVHLVPGLAILAAAALAWLGRRRAGLLVAVPIAAIVLVNLHQQTRLAAFLRSADARNPYAYVHSSPDVLKFRPLAEQALAASPQQPIRVISAEYWPLPWYLRGLPDVGYWAQPPAECDGAMLVVSLENIEAVRPRLHGSYTERILGLRPGVLLVVLTPTADR